MKASLPSSADSWTQAFASISAIFLLLCLPYHQSSAARCFECIEDVGDCQRTETCEGDFCFKSISKNDQGVGSVRKGCNQGPATGKDCEERTVFLPGQPKTELWCVCKGDWCNSALKTSQLLPYHFNILFPLIIPPATSFILNLISTQSQRLFVQSSSY